MAFFMDYKNSMTLFMNSRNFMPLSAIDKIVIKEYLMFNEAVQGCCTPRQL
jgi:hypothetical protein